jgi:hypothetical protein
MGLAIAAIVLGAIGTTVGTFTMFVLLTEGSAVLPFLYAVF